MDFVTGVYGMPDLKLRSKEMEADDGDYR